MDQLTSRVLARQLTANATSLVACGFVGFVIGRAFKRFWPIPEVDG